MVALRSRAFKDLTSDHVESLLIIALSVATAFAMIGGGIIPAEMSLGGLWPASAFATGAMIAAPAHRPFATFALVVVALVAVHRGFGVSWPASLLFGAATGAGAWMVASVDVHGRWKRIWETGPSDLFRFLAAAAAAGLIAASIGTVGLAILGKAPASLTHGWSIWLVIHAIAVVVFVPGLLALTGLRRVYPDSRTVEGAAALLLLTALSVALFVGIPGSSEWALDGALAILFPPIMWVALRAPAQLAMLAPVIVATVAAWGAADGAGPVALMAEAVTADLLAFQAFLAVAALLTLVPASLATQRSITEARLVASERLAVRATEAAELGVFEHDPVSKTLHASELLRAVFGLSRTADVTALDLLDRVMPEDRPKVAAALAGSAVDEDADLEYRVDRGNGDIRWLHQRTRLLVPSRAGPGDMRRILGAVSDVTERKRREQAALAREERLRATLDAVPGAMVTADGQGRITALYGAAVRMFGYTAPEVVGRRLDTLFPEDRISWSAFLRDGHPGKPARVRGTQRALRRVKPRETTARRSDGSTFPAELWIEATRAGGHPLTMAFVLDLSERQAVESRLKALQAELTYSARLGALGKLAPSLAHELMQPLTAVTNFATTSRDLLPADGPGDRALLAELLDEIAAQALRAGQIVRGLRDFANQGDGVKSVETLARIVRSAQFLALTGHENRRVQVTVAMDESVRVLVDQVQIQQVVVNLIRNAVDAMSERPRRELHIRVQRSNDRWGEVRVADTGPGVAPDLAARIFKPFVSTKEDGMGLGLSICKDIVEDHGGTLWIENQHPHGATFAFALPCVPDEADDA